MDRLLCQSQEITDADSSSYFPEYRDLPVEFARDKLHIKFTPAQAEGAQALLVPPYAVLEPSGNNLGKSCKAACVALWWHHTRKPSKIITTAPTAEQVELILWAEMRRLSERAGLRTNFLPRACKIWRDHNDFGIGTTARSEEAFKGKHGPNQLFIFDEAVGVAPEFWDAVETMFQPPGHAWLCLYNPTDQASRAYEEQISANKRRSRSWHIVRMSALDHPNIKQDLLGEPVDIPDAIRLDFFERIFKKNSQLVTPDPDDPQNLHLATDVRWPPDWATDYCERTKQESRWWRPGPKAEVVLLGRFPRQGTSSVWSEGDWQAAIREGLAPLTIDTLAIPEIGCDVAAQGDDNTAIHVRAGFCSIHHEEVNGQMEPVTVARLKELARIYADWYNRRLGKLPMSVRELNPLITEFMVPIKVDNDGLGGAISSFLEAAGYNCHRIGAGTKAIEEKEYPNRRSELWFAVAEMARDNQLDLSRLSEEVQEDACKQAMQVSWSFDSRGRRVVMSKDEMKAKMGRSPDTMDSLNLAYAPGMIDPLNDLPEVIYRRQNPLLVRRPG